MDGGFSQIQSHASVPCNADGHSAIYIIFIWLLSTNAMMYLIPMVLISVETNWPGS